MKKQILLFSGAAGYMLLSSFNTGSCDSYFPVKPGSVMEIKSYDEKDKHTGTVRTTITSFTNTALGMEMEAKSEIFDTKDKQTNTTQFSAKCENNTFYIDMKSFLSGQNLEAYKDMDMKIEADALDLPMNPSPGQELKSGTVKLSASSKSSGITMMNLVITVSNRKVEGLEKLTTPAGTFDCVKITYDTETQMLFKIRSKVAEWYCKGVGMVRSENYNAKGKLQGYSVLASMK